MKSMYRNHVCHLSNGGHCKWTLSAIYKNIQGQRGERQVWHIDEHIQLALKSVGIEGAQHCQDQASSPPSSWSARFPAMNSREVRCK